MDISLLDKLKKEIDGLRAACTQVNPIGACKSHHDLISAMDESSLFETLEAICKAREQVPMFKVTYDYMQTLQCF